LILKKKKKKKLELRQNLGTESEMGKPTPEFFLGHFFSSVFRGTNGI
jgi:hypothetical protein